MATEMGDLKTIVAHFSPVMQAEASLASAWLQQRAKIVQEREGLKVELTLDEATVVDDRAGVVSTWTFTGKTKADGEPWSATLRQADLLARRGANWELIACEPLDEEAWGRQRWATSDGPRTGRSSRLRTSGGPLRPTP
jgi:hypothetical protein